MTNEKKRKSFLSIFDEITQANLGGKKEDQNGHSYLGLNGENEEENHPFALTDEQDHEILMHRDAHFGGDFATMLHYYAEEEQIGINPDFDSERIEYLANVEKELKQDLSKSLLSEGERLQITRVKEAYQKLKEIYEIEEEKSTFPRLLADLILSEKEEPEEEIERVVSAGKAIVPDLIEIIKFDDAYDPLFPGYGYAPYLAIICLGRIGEERAIVPLFECLGKEMVFEEDVILEAFFNIGKPAKEFLIRTLKGRPLTNDNVNAAFALCAFADDVDVAILSFLQLQDPDVQDKPLLRLYLVCQCNALQNTEYQAAFEKMAQDEKIPADLRKEVENIVQNWSDSSL